MENIILGLQNAANTIATPNWADVISIIISGFAILVAGLVARKQNKISLVQTEIVERQNKIALFEKRFELYEIISECIVIDEHTLSLVEKPSDIYLLICSSFDSMIASVPDKNMAISCILNVNERLKQSEFLFSENVSKDVENLATSLFKLVNVDRLGLERTRKEFHQTIEDLKKNKTIEEIKQKLKLQ